MICYSWLGNVRELKSMMERAVLISETLKIEIGYLVFFQ
jgi:transcriptional regulator with AAA-type ATPase domain